MKRILLIISLFSIGSLMAQANFTKDNYHKNGSHTYFLCDSVIPTFNDVKGSNVTWSYDTINKIDGVTNVFIIKDSTDAFYATADQFINNGDNTNDFLETSSATDIRHGMNINVPDIGFVSAYFDVIAPKVMEYPFAFNTKISDTLSGYADVVGLSLLNRSLWGKHYTEYDGYGKLIIGNTTVNGVSRVHSYDTLSVDTEDPGIDTIMVILDVYEYYRFEESTFPVFYVSSLQIILGGTAVVLNKSFSMYDPSENQVVGIENISNTDFQLSPNPAKDQFTLLGDFEQAEVQIVDNLGKIVYQGTSPKGATINVERFNSGLYFVNATINGATITKKLIKY